MIVNIKIRKGATYSEFKHSCKGYYEQLPDPDEAMRKDYEELTGHVVKSRNKKGNKKAGQGGSVLDEGDASSG